MSINYNKISRNDLEENDNKTINSLTYDSHKETFVEIPRHDFFKTQDSIFFNKVMFDLNNKNDVNSVFINELKDKEYTDYSMCQNIIFDNVSSLIKLEPNKIYGEYYTIPISTYENCEAYLNNFYLLADQDIPDGTDISYYLITNNNEVYPIRVNDNEAYTLVKPKIDLPITITIKAVLRSTYKNRSPKIKGIALLYKDTLVEEQMGLLNPNLAISEMDSSAYAPITLYRDPNNDDRLYKVGTRDTDILLTYNQNQELTTIETYDNSTSMRLDKTMLVYGDYVNSKQKTERVLQQVLTEAKKTE